MRKEIQIEIQDSELLKFKVKQMPATVAERFMTKALMLLGRAGTLEALGINGTTDFKDIGKKKIDVVAVLTTLCKLDYDEVQPLLDTLLNCCSRITDGGVTLPCTPETVDGYIDSPKTLFKLRIEAGKFNFGFFKLGENSPTGTEKETPNTKHTKISVIE